MRKVFMLGICVLFAFSASAQFGVKGSYHFSNATDWQVPTNNGINTESLIGDGWSVGVDYWFRLKNYRMEFLPELNFSQLNQNLDNADWSNQVTFTSFFFNTNIYLFDFKGDCDCPTFSKQGPTLDKGFFVQVSPGLTFAQSEIDFSGNTLKADDLAFSIGLGVGFDLGVSDLVTVSPMAGLRYFPSISWDSLAENPDDETPRLEVEDSSSSLTQWYAGVRIGFRLDYGY
ncbi:MAG: outer membrane beta-barrel protein [Saprospiraceae bacterium]|nr:outer membrane beta-barrel protein [Saprospiraceae bacterium]